MPDINIRTQIEGLDALLKGFQRVTTSIQAPMRELERRVAERLKHYPPQPPASTYIRTGHLGESWTVSADALGTNLYQDRVSMELHNEVRGPRGESYAGWVQGADTQTEQHARTGWETTQQAIDAETNPFLQDVANAVDGAFH